ncbi:hypothetical protein BS78_09G178800 [Paspalum vaginatum]|nr:hypothetical protein BS78_09G178800 [Paspalum vaginatum]KAJ1263365.1 hypothetical protein BS78_09G178800 [Paspalum vaginatum]
MERRHAGKPLLTLVVLSCLLLLLPLAVSVPVPRSLRQGSQQQQQHPPTLKLIVSQEAARMDVEVNDYPPAGANTKHDPPPPVDPGRA